MLHVTGVSKKRWDTGVAKKLYLMALVISESTQVITFLVPFVLYCYDESCPEAVQH